MTTVSVSPLFLLFLLFLGLKLGGVITWSWWWITAPLWLPCLVAGTALLAVLLVGGVLALLSLGSRFK